MKKSVTDYPIGLLISVLVIFLIVYYSSIEIGSFLRMQKYQEFASDISSIVDSMEYLKGSNSAYSFLGINVSVPENQSVYFDSLNDLIELKGYYERNISLGNDLENDLLLAEMNEYSVILCYLNCSNNYEYLVVFR